MTKRQGATSDKGFFFEKINKEKNIKEKKKIHQAVLEIIPFIRFYLLG